MRFLKIGAMAFAFFSIVSCGGKKENQTMNQLDSIASNILPEKIEVETDAKELNGMKQPEWAKNAVIYEVNTRQFSKEGTFKQVTNQLSRIRSLGVDVIWLMPIHPIGEKNRKGKLGSYYAVKDYEAINPEFGTKEDFKQLVDSAHTLGMKVLIDWVANHSSPDNKWVKEHLDYYTKDSLGNAPIPTVGTDWDDVADLNYDNPELRKAMTSAMKYWVKEFDIDGFRCDVAGMVPLDFWKENRKALDSIKPVFMLAEGSEPELHEAFNMTYGWPFKDSIIAIAKGDKNFQSIDNYFNYRVSNFKPNDLIMYFTTNHDENSWNYTENEAFGNNADNYAVLTYVMGGMPLIYNGQEAGLNKRLEFFEKDPIVWGDYKRAGFYKQLNNLLKKQEVLWSDGETGKFEIIKATKESFQFIRSKNGKMLAFLQNYSNKEQFVSRISLNGFDLTYNMLTEKEIPDDARGVVIPPHETIVIGQNK